MIYLVLFWEFCKIGLLAIGGGLVTIPFLMELTDKYDWFSKQQLADMIAVSESTPGPIGVNMATYGGFNAAGIWGGLAATLGLVFPSLVVIVLISKYVMKYQSCLTFQNILLGIRPAVLALILYAGYILAELAINRCHRFGGVCRRTPLAQAASGHFHPGRRGRGNCVSAVKKSLFCDPPDWKLDGQKNS